MSENTEETAFTESSDMAVEEVLVESPAPAPENGNSEQIVQEGHNEEEKDVDEEGGEKDDNDEQAIDEQTIKESDQQASQQSEENVQDANEREQNQSDQAESSKESVPISDPVLGSAHGQSSAAARESISKAPVIAAIPKRKRLPNDIIGRLEDDIEDSPQDIDKWTPLINELKSRDKVDELRATYERMLTQFPTSANTWIDYLDLEQSNGEFHRVEQLFARCLPKVPNVELWSYYLAYIRRVNNIHTDGDRARTVIAQAYEFVLDRIGHDAGSGHIWSEYIDFIKSREAPSTWEQQQKMDLLRKTYRRAICIPLTNLESLWQGYNAFESNLNKTTARKFIAERSAAYMNARSSLRELENMTGGLNRSTSPHPRLWLAKELKKVKQWEKWIEWEMKNPLQSEDPAVVDTRITYAYKQAMMTLRYYPEIWFNAANYAFSQSRDTEGMEILMAGIQANPASFLLSFKAAEVLEKEAKFDEMKGIFETLITYYKNDREKKIYKQQQADNEDELNGRGGQHLSKKRRKELQQQMMIKENETAVLETSARNITMAYSEYMKVSKRCRGIKEARRIFGEARRFAYTTYHIFVASAMMEYHNNKEAGIADKIFELGLKRYSDNAEFVKTYFDFLVLTNDETNARALFEKSVTKMTPEAAKPLYEHFLKYTANYGELAALTALEERFSKIYPDEPILMIFSRRYLLGSYDPIDEVDLRRISAQQQQQLQLQQQLQQQQLLNQQQQQQQQHSSRRNNSSNVNQSGGGDDGYYDSDNSRPSKRSKNGNSNDSNLEQVTYSALPAGILTLLKLLPPRDSYNAVTFDPAKLVKLVHETQIPDSLLEY